MGAKKYVRKFPAMVKWMAEGMLVSRHAAQVTGCIYQVEKKDCKQQCQGKIRKM